MISAHVAVGWRMSDDSSGDDFRFVCSCGRERHSLFPGAHAGLTDEQENACSSFFRLRPYPSPREAGRVRLDYDRMIRIWITDFASILMFPRLP